MKGQFKLHANMYINCILIFFTITEITPAFKINSQVEERIVIVTPNVHEFYLHNQTSHYTFMSWYRNATMGRIEDGVTYGICNSRKNVSELFVEMDGMKYTIMQLLHALLIDDLTYSQLLLEIVHTHYQLKMENPEEWLRNNFKFPKNDAMKIVNNAEYLNNNFSVFYPPYVYDIFRSLAESYNLLEKSIEDKNLPMAKWLIHLGYSLSNQNSSLLSTIWQQKNYDFLNHFLNHIDLLNKSTLEELKKIEKVSNGEFLNFIIIFERLDVISSLLDSNSTDIVLVLLKAIEINKFRIVSEFSGRLKFFNGNMTSAIQLLHACVDSKLTEIVKTLVELRVPLNVKDNSGLTPIYKAIAMQNAEIAQTLINGENCHMSLIESVKNAFLTAVSRNNTDVLRHLISFSPVANELERYVLTGLKTAIEKDYKEIAGLLLDTISNDSLRGEFLLHYTVAYGSNDVLSILLNRGLSVDSLDGEGNTPLCIAASKPDRMKVLLLAEYGAYISQQCESGNTPLHIAILHSYYHIIRILTVLGGNVNATNNNGETPLHNAVLVNSTQITAYLIQKGAHRDYKYKNGSSLLHLAAGRDSTAVIGELILSGINVNVLNNAGETPLEIAVRNNKSACIRMLASYGADIFQITSSGDTLLHVAVEQKCIDAMIVLMKLGLSHMNVNKNGNSSIEIAILKNDYQLMWSLINNASPLIIDVKYAIIASLNGCLNSLKALSDFMGLFSININKKDHVTGQTPLSEAVRGNHPAVVKFLKTKGGNINYKTIDGDSLVHLAAINGSTDALMALYEYKLPLDTQNKHGEKPMWLAAKHGNLDTMKLLREYGVGVDIHFENATLLLPASRIGNEEVVSWLLNQGVPIEGVNLLGENALMEASANGNVDVVQFLLAYGAEIDVADINGWTSLHKAAYTGQTQVAHALINYGASPNIKAVSNLTPLHYASINGYLKIVKFLIEVQADLDVQDTKGWTPLHWAAYKGHANVVEELISAGASTSVVSSNGVAPIELAKRRSHKTIEKLLQSENGNEKT